MTIPPRRTRRTGGPASAKATAVRRSLGEGGKILLFAGLNLRVRLRPASAGQVLRVLLRKCDRLLTPRTCQAAIAPTTMNAKAQPSLDDDSASFGLASAKVAKLSTTCNRESRDQVSRGSGRRRRREATP